MIRVAYPVMFNEFLRVLLKMGFSQERAELCARLFAETSRDGVYSHGLNRFPRFISYIKQGYINVEAVPERVDSYGAWERWDGRLGPGNLNAYHCMGRALTLARDYGMGCVALKNTNHWMRGGSYGWQAVEAGSIGICWTNTTPNLPAWGSKECTLGNNPLILAVPRPGGHIVLDLAMSQFSYGKMETLKLAGEQLPLDGGYDQAGNLTKDPEAILQTRRPLPIGFWKGSGLSLLLDLIAAMLSGGATVTGVGKLGNEYGLSQVFLAFNLEKLPDHSAVSAAVEEVITDLHQAEPERADGRVYYPGERTLLTREENLKNGIPVDEAIWQQVLQL